MTDKLRELMAKLHRLADYAHNVDAGVSPDTLKGLLNELSALLAEPAPAGEWDARAWVPKAREVLKKFGVWGQRQGPNTITWGENVAQAVADELETAYAAARLSHPAERRDPAVK